MNRPQLSILSATLIALLAVGCSDQVVDPAVDGAELQAARVTDQDHGGRLLTAMLSGAAEVPGPGDEDGSGKAYVTLNQGQGEICFKIMVADIDPPTAAHIHMGAADVSGGVAVNFDVATNGLEGCVAAEKGLIKMIRNNPAGYYVNVHNPAFPPGAVRGQLYK